MIVPEQAIRAMQTVVLGDGDTVCGHVPSVEDCRVVIEAVAPFLELDAQARIAKTLEWAKKRLAAIDAEFPDFDGGYCSALDDVIEILSDTKGEN